MKDILLHKFDSSGYYSKFQFSKKNLIVSGLSSNCSRTVVQQILLIK